MEFLVSYKVVKQCIQTDKIVENIDSLVLDNKSTPEYPIDYKNVVHRNVPDTWTFETSNPESSLDGYGFCRK